MSSQQPPKIDEETISTYEQLKKQYHMAIQAQAKVLSKKGSFTCPGHIVPSRNQHIPDVLQGDDVGKDLERKSRHKQLMLAELSKLEPDAVTYKNVGKAYIMAPRGEIMSQYEEDYVQVLEAMKKCKADKATIEKQVDSYQSELREFLSANPLLAQAVLR